MCQKAVDGSPVILVHYAKSVWAIPNFKELDVLFAKITPCKENGKGFHAKGLENGLGFASTEFHVLRAKENADPGFIYQWSIYRPLRLRVAAAMTGSAGQQRVPETFFCLSEFLESPNSNKPKSLRSYRRWTGLLNRPRR
jgi:hypothetical protein